MLVGEIGLPLVRVEEHPTRLTDYRSRLFFFDNFVEQSEFGKLTLKRISEDERFLTLKGRMLSNGSGATRVESASSLTAWWLWRANEVGAAKADADLHAFLTNEEIDSLAVLWVHGVTADEIVRLSDEVSLVPISLMNDSEDKETFLQAAYDFSRHTTISPNAALVVRHKVRKIVPNMTVSGPEPGFWESTQPSMKAFERLNLVATLLNCVSSICCLPGWSSTYPPPEVPLGPFASRGGGIPLLDVLPRQLTKFDLSKSGVLQELECGFHKRDDTSKARIRAALMRLAQSKSRLDVGDKALDLGIALEMLLLNSEHTNQELPGQLNLHFRLRGSWLIGKDFEHRQRLYKALGQIYSYRSQLAHNGVSSELTKMKYDDRQVLFNEFFEIAEQIIQRVIVDGTPSNWSNLTLGELS